MRRSESGTAAHNPLGLWKGKLYNILSRLYILHHYHYEDVILNPVGARFLKNAVTAESYHFTAELKFALFRESHITQDWYDFKGKRVHTVTDSVKDCSTLAVSITALTVLYGGRDFRFTQGQKTVTVYKRVELGSEERAERTFEIEPFFKYNEYVRRDESPEDLLDRDLSDMMNVLRGRVRDYLFNKEESGEFKSVFS